MKLEKEPKEIDFVIKSEPWSEKDAADFSILIQEIKSKNKRKRTSASTKSANPAKAAKSRNHLS
ncbi:MAG: hypothetical protein WA584_16815 [Pyrinomonadaceae bacterium]